MFSRQHFSLKRLKCIPELLNKIRNIYRSKIVVCLMLLKTYIKIINNKTTLVR